MDDRLLLAHLYGAPEIASIVVPLLLFVLILRAGRKRREAEEAEAAASPDGSAGPADEAG